MPMGRQCASGLSLLLSDIRFFTRSAAQGWYGAPPCVLLPILPNGDPPPPPPRPPRPAAGGGAFGSRVISHTPDKSGLPSDVFGTPAFASSFPSAPTGTPVGVYFGHCAITVVDAATTRLATASFVTDRTLGSITSCPPALLRRRRPSATSQGTACGHP